MADCQSDVKAFLTSTNRPYNCNDIANNFQNKHNKLAISKALDSLVCAEEVVEKINGKQKIFFINQDKIQFNEESSKELNAKIEQYQNTIEILQKVVREKRAKLNSLQNHVPTKVLEEKLKTLNEEVSIDKKKLLELESKCSDLSLEENVEIKSKQTKLNDEWRKRKRLATEMIDTIMENYSKSKKSFIEEVGIETDEEMNIVIPN